MASRSGSETRVRALASTLWFTLALVVMVGSTRASRVVPQIRCDPQGAHLQAYFDPGSNEARHAPPVKSFLVSDGSWVDCVPIEGQIAAHHPSLKDHVVATPPPQLGEPSLEPHPQLFAREYVGCPEGSIPVLRDDPSRFLMRKTAPPFVREACDNAAIEEPAAAAAVHEYAVTGMPQSNHAYAGSKSIFSVNNPYLGNSNDMTLSQTWLVDGSYSDNSLSTIEVGWQTQPNLHPSDAPTVPHLFIYWTNNAYGNTGPGSCYNLLCPGFIQTSNTWVIGGAMPQFSNTDQFEVTIQVFYDPGSKAWWLFLNNAAVGYWPRSIYRNGYMQGTCNQVQWGGEVAFQRGSGTTHSNTAMGTGQFPAANWPNAAYQRNISYTNPAIQQVNAAAVTLNSNRIFNNPLCYDIQVQLSNYVNWGTYFFFGGPGGRNNPSCHY